MKRHYREIMTSFLKLGSTGFGGPLATMAMMEEEFSRRRGWVDAKRFSEIYTLCKLLPGPVATQMAIFLGYLRAGRLGGVIAGVSFVLPSFVLVLAISVIYLRSGVVERAEPFFSGLQAAALAVIALSGVQLGRPYLTRPWPLAIIAVSAALTRALPTWEPAFILGFGLMELLRTRPASNPGASTPREAVSTVGTAGWLTWRSLATAGTAGALGGTVLTPLIWTCFKAGAFVFGTGLAIVPLLEADVVHRYGWLTGREFMDGLAIGQVTPGPVVITATFIGFKVAGYLGAVAATAAVFLPGFLNVLVILPSFWNRVSGTDIARRFVSGAIPAVVGGIAGATLKLGFITLIDGPRIAIFVIAIALGLRFRTPAYFLIPGAGLIAWAVSLWN